METRRIQREPGMPASSLGASGAAWMRPQQVPMTPPFPSGVSPASTRSRARPDLWRQVVGAGEPLAWPTPPPAPRPPRCFRPVLAHVQLLWELMLLGEPLLVLAPSPAVSSEMVLALTRWAGRPRGGRGPGAQGWPRVLTAPRAPTSAAACSPSSSAAITAPTSPSMTASSRSSLRAHRPRKRCPRPLPRPAPCPPNLASFPPSFCLSLSLDQTWSWESQTLSLSKHFSTGPTFSELGSPRHQVRLSQPPPRAPGDVRGAWWALSLQRQS